MDALSIVIAWRRRGKPLPCPGDRRRLLLTAGAAVPAREMSIVLSAIIGAAWMNEGAGGGAGSRGPRGCWPAWPAWRAPGEPSRDRGRRPLPSARPAPGGGGAHLLEPGRAAGPGRGRRPLGHR